MKKARIATVLLLGILLVSGLACGSGEWRLLTYTEGEGTISPNTGTFPDGAVVTLTALPESGWDFDHWGVQASGSENPITVKMDSDKTVSAYFVEEQNVVLFSDDFSDPSSGWTIYSDYEGSAFYRNGWLHVRDAPFGSYAENSPAGVYLTDFILEVETKLVSGTDDNWHRVICRAYENPLDLTVDGYYIDISADGYFEIFKAVNGEQIFIKNPTYSRFINRGIGTTNLIHIECIGSTLSLSVNGHLITKQTDYSLTVGDIYLGADAMGDSRGTEVAFDNLVVTAP